jgi:para-aminobenzoate synthetase/4-amino-4-deoxychorismate lyase
LYHKTTNRALYDSQHKVYAAKGYLDVIFLNTRNEVTEGAISNIMIQKAGRLYTPVLDSGLLPGIFRQHLLDIGKAKEKKLTLIDLRKADKIFICNSVRGLVEVKLREG